MIFVAIRVLHGNKATASSIRVLFRNRRQVSEKVITVEF